MSDASGLGWGGRLGRWAVRRRWMVIVASLVLTAASLLAFGRLKLDLELLAALPAGEPAFDDFRDFLETFGATQILPVVVDGVPAAQLPRALDALAARFRTLPEVTSATAGIDVSSGAPHLDPLHVPALVPAARFPELAARLEPAAIAAALARAKRTLSLPVGGLVTERLRTDPLGVSAVAAEAIRAGYVDPATASTDPHLIAPDGAAGLVLVNPAGSPFDAIFTQRLLAALRRAVDAVRAEDPALADVRVQWAGAYAQAEEDARLVQHDVLRYVGLAFLAVITIFQLGFRNASVLPLIGYQLVSGSLIAFASDVLVYRELNALSLSFAAVFFGLAVDSGIHFFTRLQEERLAHPLEEAIVRTCDGIATAHAIATVTTAAAFVVIMFSSITAVREIGLLTGLGMMWNIPQTLLLLPAVTAAFPGRFAARATAASAAGRPVAWLGRVAGALARHARPVLGVTFVVVLAAAVAAREVPVDAEVEHLRAHDSAARRAEAALASHFGALVPAGAAVVTGPDLDAALEREERVTAWLATHRAPAGDPASAGGTPRIAGFTALSTFLPARATEIARRQAFAALPLADARAALHEELRRQGFRAAAFADADRLFDAGGAALPRDLDAPWLRPLAGRHVGRRGAAVALATFLEPAPGTAVAEVRDAVRADLGPSVTVTGRVLLQEALARSIAREVVWFTLASLALNLAIVWFQVRDVRGTLVIMAPTAVTVVLLVGGMALAGFAFTPINLIVLPLALGIGVDHCVYIVGRMQEGLDLESAIAHVGRAIGITALTTMAGFGCLAVSRYPGLAGLGWLAAVSTLLTLIAAIVLLPAFLRFAPALRARAAA